MDTTFVFVIVIAGFSFGICYGGRCPYTYASSYRTKICDAHWGWCWHTKYVERYRQSTKYRCCPGYVGSNCNTAVCSPPCTNQGRCVAPNQCQCLQGTVGNACEQITCSHLKPCFPGICSFPDICRCQDGFGGTTCLTLLESPTMLRCSAFLLMKERSSGKEMYRFTTDSSSPDNHQIDMIWVNQNAYNIMNVYFEADFSPYIHNLPDDRYIEDYAFGIVDGYAQLTLNKITRPEPRNYNCLGYPNTSNVNSRMECNITDTNFDWLLEHGDNMTVTVTAKNGGYRHILNENTHRRYATQQFTGRIYTKQMQYMFDFHSPRHCSENNSCTHNEPPLHLSNDISKMPVTMTWGGWIDDLSGVNTYTVYVYRLEPDSRTGELTESNTNMSLYTKQIKINESFPLYIPDTIGMYTILLEVADKANNIMYARRLFLFDNVSQISVNDNDMAIYSSVGIKHLWISTLQNESTLGQAIQIRWANHFVNKEHVRLKLLTRVSPFKSETFNGIRPRYVKPGLDDNDGSRMMQPVDNMHGIVRVQTAFKRDKDGGTTITQVPLLGWKPVAGYRNEQAAINVVRQDGDSIRIWVRAFDVVNNSATDSILVHVDSSPPVVEQPAFHKNIENASYPFSSRLSFHTTDRHSGIHLIKWKLTANESGEVFHSGSEPGNITKRKPSLQEGACTSDGECYYFYHAFEVNNCWFMVPKDDLPTQVTNIDIEVFNSAMLSSFGRLQVDDLTSLSGMEEYSGPMHLEVTGTTSYSANFQWYQGPSCYDRTDILLMYNVSGQTRTMHVHKDSEYYTLGNLNPETTYIAQFVVAYGDEQSDPVKITFTTGAYEGLSGGAIAGITIVMLILVGLLIAGIVLWRTGKLNRYKESIYGHIQRRTTRRRRSNPYSGSEDAMKKKERKSYANLAFSDVGDDDVYMYGQMVFNEDQLWEVHHDQVSLVEKITTGRFADIFKASQNCKKNKRNLVVAKVLKESHTELDELVMNAKINFFATKVGSHANVIQFVGAVLDNKPLGPFMLMELCEGGVMRTWLQNQKTNMSESLVDTLYRMTFDIAKGMDFLASKQIIHRHLAARNILLTSSHEAKVAGFGPTKETEQQDGDTGREKVPIKWKAPECMTSLQEATMQSDVWSYGIVMWEIFSLGDTPYPGIRSMEVATKVTNGYRMSRPEYSADMHYQLMTKCWQEKQSSRPTFSAIVQEISSTFSSSQDDCYYYETK